MTTFDNVAAREWKSWVDQNDATILDVREPDEWALGTLPDSLLISQGDLVDRIDEVPKDKPVLCVCRTGGRSSHVAMFLSFNGYEAANLVGGMKGLGMQE